MEIPGSLTDYNLDLFLALNKEYESKPIVPTPRSYAPAALRDLGLSRAASLQKSFRIAGKRVLEIGCGHGEVADALASKHGCEAWGVDIVEYKEWGKSLSPSTSLRVLDITCQDYSELGQFDFIYSFVVWEHIEHPYAGLRAVRDLLRPHGRFYLKANLYRGPIASHLYRDVFFPWPHLLFPDSVFIQFYHHIGKKPRRPAWVNKLTAAHYILYFDQLGFETQRISYGITPIDEGFYARFEDVLGRYPRFDLERDHIQATLLRGAAPSHA
jgi:SAM-dependent methyltransferase